MTPLDLILRHSRLPATAGLGAACAPVDVGTDLCRYGPGPKEPQVQAVLQAMRQRFRESLSPAPADRQALLSILQPVFRAGFSTRVEGLRLLRDTLRSRVRYLDDPPGVDSVQSLHASLARGVGDCVSLTIALSALALSVFPGASVVWRIGGDRNDPSRHVWPVIDGIPVDAADPMPPLGREVHFEVTREVQP
jgi:hypothetical protein